MIENLLAMLFEHNNWANEKIIQACDALPDDQLDAQPHSATKGSIRSTLLHLVTAQQGYLNLLTLPLEARMERPVVAFADLQASAQRSGEGLLALAREASANPLVPRLQTKNNYLIEPWVVMVQVINHATEHREQIKSMLTALGVTPPDIDGWDFGESVGAILSQST